MQKLKAAHTVERFSAPEDLAHKVRRDIQRYLALKQPISEGTLAHDEEFDESAELLKEFQLTPKRLNGQEVLIRIELAGEFFPASRSLCNGFNLEYCAAIGVPIHMLLTNQS